MAPSREQLTAILDCKAHAWIENRLYELARIRDTEDYDIWGVDSVEFDGDKVTGRAYYHGGDCNPTALWVVASVDDLLSAEAAHESWMEEQRLLKEKQDREAKERKAKEAIAQEARERQQLARLQEKYGK